MLIEVRTRCNNTAQLRHPPLFAHNHQKPFLEQKRSCFWQLRFLYSKTDHEVALSERLRELVSPSFVSRVDRSYLYFAIVNNCFVTAWYVTRYIVESFDNKRGKHAVFASRVWQRR